MTVYLDLGDAKAARAVVAATPQSARAAGLLSMHDGDWRRAGLSAYDEEGWTRDDDHCELWQGEALRDYALKTGELSRAIAFIKLKYYFGDAPAEHLEVCNYRAAVYLSQLLAAAGQAEQALALRRAASSWNDANEAKYLGGSRRLRAAVLLLDGKQDAALAELAESFRSGLLRAIGGTPLTTIPCGCRCTATRDSRPSPPTCAAMSTRSAASSRRCAGKGAVPRRADPAAAH